VEVGVAVGVTVGVWVGVDVGVCVGVAVCVGVGVCVAVWVGVGVCVGVAVCVGVEVTVWVGVWVGVAVDVGVGVEVGVDVGVRVTQLPVSLHAALATRSHPPQSPPLGSGPHAFGPHWQHAGGSCAKVGAFSGATSQMLSAMTTGGKAIRSCARTGRVFQFMERPRPLARQGRELPRRTRRVDMKAAPRHQNGDAGRARAESPRERSLT